MEPSSCFKPETPALVISTVTKETKKEVFLKNLEAFTLSSVAKQNKLQ